MSAKTDLPPGWTREPPEPGNRALLVRYIGAPEGLHGIARHNGARWVFFWDDAEEDDEYIHATFPKGVAWAYANDCGPSLEDEPTGWVYLVRSSEWTTKIEFTTDMSTYGPAWMTLLGHVAAKPGDKVALHERYAAKRTDSGWFRLDDDDIAAILARLDEAAAWTPGPPTDKTKRYRIRGGDGGRGIFSHEEGDPVWWEDGEWCSIGGGTLQGWPRKVEHRLDEGASQ